MSGHPHHPPPGEQPHPPPGTAAYPPPGRLPYAAPPPAGHGPQPFLGAAHKPGAVPLRPLGLGDVFDGAFKVIRYNPAATVGSAVVVAAVAMLVPVGVTAVATWATGAGVDVTVSPSPADAEAIGLVVSLGSLVVGSLLQALGLLLVAGMVAHVVAAAAVGRRLGMGQAWGATRGKRWRLLGLSLLLMLMASGLVGLYAGLWVAVVVLSEGVLPLVLFGLASVPVFLCALFWFWVRVYLLPVPALMLEDVGIRGAIGRGYRLTRGQFWRVFGIALLALVTAQVAAGILGLPVVFGGQLLLLTVGPEYQLMGLVVVQALATVLTATFATPFVSAVTALQYVDQRMRKEAFDVELMSRAGITGS